MLQLYTDYKDKGIVFGEIDKTNPYNIHNIDEIVNKLRTQQFQMLLQDYLTTITAIDDSKFATSKTIGQVISLFDKFKGKNDSVVKTLDESCKVEGEQKPSVDAKLEAILKAYVGGRDVFEYAKFNTSGGLLEQIKTNLKQKKEEIEKKEQEAQTKLKAYLDELGGKDFVEHKYFKDGLAVFDKNGEVNLSKALPSSDGSKLQEFLVFAKANKLALSADNNKAKIGEIRKALEGKLDGIYFQIYKQRVLETINGKQLKFESVVKIDALLQAIGDDENLLMLVLEVI